MTTERENFMLCACCPCPCRRNIAVEGQEQIETATPSAMSLIALAVLDEAIDVDAAVRTAFGRTKAIRSCRAACPYDLDIAGAIDRLAARLIS